VIKAILFDAAGTLIHLPKGVGWHYREVAARHGLELDESMLNPAFARAFRTAPARLQTGVARPDDDKGWWRGLVREVFAACNEHPEEGRFAGFFEELYRHFAQPGVWELYPEVIPVLESLRPHCALGVLSNFDRRLYPILDELGIRRFFDSITISSEHGLDKPDPRLFAVALASLKATPSETIHAGDHPQHDWLAAESAGLHAFRLDRPGVTLASLPDLARIL
jgi:putative hydrolase of the HAD superfamily